MINPTLRKTNYCENVSVKFFLLLMSWRSLVSILWILQELVKWWFFCLFLTQGLFSTCNLWFPCWFLIDIIWEFHRMKIAFFLVRWLNEANFNTFLFSSLDFMNSEMLSDPPPKWLFPFFSFLSHKYHLLLHLYTLLVVYRDPVVFKWGVGNLCY